jgi:hypothetical protein
MLHMNKPHSKYARLYAGLLLIKPDNSDCVRWHAAGIVSGMCIEMGFSYQEVSRFGALASRLAGAFQ